MAQPVNPAQADITLARLTSYDGSKVVNLDANFIAGFEIVQSMASAAYSIVLDVLDGANVLTGFPLRGEEYLNLWIKGLDQTTELKLLTRVVRITDIKPSQSANSVTFKMHLASVSSWKSLTKKVVRPFNSSINLIAKEVFEDSFEVLSNTAEELDPTTNAVMPYATQRWKLDGAEQDRYFYIQPTDGFSKGIIPDLIPSEAMNFLASRAYSADSKSQTFRFFETLENYYFCTDEYFIQKANNRSIVNLFYAPIVDYTPTELESQMCRVENVHILNKGIDSITDVMSGSYNNQVIEVDLIRRTFNISEFDFQNARYIDMNGTPRNPADQASNPHTERFRTESFVNNPKTFMVFKNYLGPGDQEQSNPLHPDRYMAEIAHNRVSYYHHLNNTSVAVALKGRLDLRPGMIANLSIPRLNGAEPSNAIHDSLSGKYLIQGTSHTMGPNGTVTTGLKLAKFDWSVGLNNVTNNETSAEVLTA